MVEIWKEFAVGSISIRNPPVIKAIADFVPISLISFKTLPASVNVILTARKLLLAERP